MSVLLDLFLSIVMALLFLVFAGALILWLTHISQTRSYTDVYGWANYRKFVKHFNTVEWENSSVFKNSLFNKSDWHVGKTSEIHANIIKFNEKGMIINNPISYLFVLFYVYNYINKKRKKVKW